MTHRWLDRRISAPGPFLTLCLSDSEYRKALNEIGVDPIGPWISAEQADATVHHIRCDKGQAAVVCVRGFEGRDPIEVAGLFVHESVHIWQEWCDYCGEHNPGREQEAYAIQAVSQELMAEFARRMK